MDILNFNPSQLSNFNKEENSPKYDSLIYKPRPSDSKSDDGVYRSVIKVIYNPFDLRNSVLEQQSYAMFDSNGFFSVVSSLTDNDTSCPIFKAWKQCHFARKKDGTFDSEFNETLWLQQAKNTETILSPFTHSKRQGKQLFEKRYARYVTIQVIEDKNNPELENKYMFWKMPKFIWDMIQTKMTPAAESRKAAIPVMDFLVGRAIELEVTPGPDDPQHPERKTREISYATSTISDDIVSCVRTDGSPLLTDDQQDILDNYAHMMSKVWKEKNPDKRRELQIAVDSDENTKKFAQLYSESIIPAIQEICPNLIDKLGYKTWSPDVQARVNNWISIVLQGKDPKESADTTAVYTPELQNQVVTPGVMTDIQGAPLSEPSIAEPIPAIQVPSMGGADDDDLPF